VNIAEYFFEDLDEGLSSFMTSLQPSRGMIKLEFFGQFWFFLDPDYKLWSQKSLYKPDTN